MTPAIHAIRLLGTDLALVDGDLNYSSGVDPAGTRRCESSQPFVAVMTRTADEWLLLSIRVGAAAPAGKPAVSSQP
jgi:hypothetical protein